MRGLLILLVSPNRVRAEAAVRLAMAHAALGARTRLHLDEAAVSLLDEEPAFADAIEAGVAVSVCHSGLAESGRSADTLLPGIDVAGPLALLADLGDDRLVTI